MSPVSAGQGQDDPISEGRPPGPRSYLPRSGTVLRVLTATQNCSALVFSVFVGIHLVSPLAAAVGGLSAADNALLLGREYYLPSETLTIYLPLTLHLSSSVLKRIALYLKTRRAPPITPHLVTGWMLPFLVLPHIRSHRLIPSTSAPPIAGLSPSELGMEFVGWGINRWPIWSYMSYTALVGVMMWHGGVGMMKVVSWLKRGRGVATPNPTGNVGTKTSEQTERVGEVEQVELVQKVDPSVEAALDVGAVGDEEQALDTNAKGVQATRAAPRKISAKRKLGLRSLLLVFIGVVGVGLARIARESKYVSRVMALRYEAVYSV